MGFSHSWIAVRGLTREAALEAVGMEISAEQTELLEGTSLFDWPNEWLIVVSDDYLDALQGQLSELGSLGEVAVACGTDDEALYFAACGYQDGSDVWSVKVNPAKHVFRVVGYPPEQLDPIIGEAKIAEADGIDLFSAIPAALAESICGFALDGDLAAIEHVSLKSTGAKPRKRAAHGASHKSSFLARLFGRAQGAI